MLEDDTGLVVHRGPSWPAVIITSLIISAGVFVGLRLCESRGLLAFLRPATRNVPTVTGVSADQARALLEPQGLLLSIDSERPHATVAAGLIAEQAPLSGSVAAEGTAVHVVVSRGVAQVPVPVLVGLRKDDALRLLQDKQFIPGTITTAASDSVEAGQVSGSEPPAGKSAAAGSAINLIVSSGKNTVPAPKVVGMSLSRAKKTLEAAGFKVGTTKYGSSETADGGIVLSQDPAESAPAVPGSAINLIVNEPD